MALSSFEILLKIKLTLLGKDGNFEDPLFKKKLFQFSISLKNIWADLHLQGTVRYIKI